jgi:CDP-6-deoxy-D-xylo-4-hexulose-3-dehydrase
MSKEEEMRNKVFDDLRALYEERARQAGEFKPLRDKVQYAGSVYGYEEVHAMVGAILDGWFGVGKNVSKFETKLADFLGSKKALMVNSGSSANLVAMASLTSGLLGVKRLLPGDEVITPASTFPTTLNPILQTGLAPVLTDVKLSTYNLDPWLLKKALSKRTRAIMIPHTLGNPNEMDAIMEFAEENRLYVIEDTSDSLGSRYGGRYLGTIGDFGTFSFYPAHHITTGEGGAVTTSDMELYRIALSIRDWGRACVNPVCTPQTCGDTQCPRSLRTKGKDLWESLPEDYDKRYSYSNIGYNLKPIEVQGAMGVAQMGRLPSFIEARKRNFRFLYDAVAPYGRHFHLPESPPKSDPCWFALPLTVREGAPFTRRQLVNHFTCAKVEVKLMFAGNITCHPAYKGVPMRVAGALKNSDAIMRGTFFLGVYPGLNKEKLEFMVKVFEDFMSNYT